MLKIETAISFFGNNRPSGIPKDTSTPDLDRLIQRTLTLDSSLYPIQTLKEILRRENTRIFPSETVRERINSIDNITVFVVCGQQTGLFGGPLYTLYKAIHIIHLASILSKKTGRNVVPLFWAASDDHDFDEVKSLGVRTNDGITKKITYEPNSYFSGKPVGDIILDDDILEVVHLLEKHCTRGVGTDSYLEIIHSSWQPGKTWSDAFSSQMLMLFSHYGLVMFDPRWPGIKSLFSDIITTELNDPLASSGLLNKTADSQETSQMRRKALRKPANSTNIFFEINGIRYPLFFNNNIFSAGESTFSKEELLDISTSSPERFSPGAALRPLCQDAVLPTTAIIGGPGERLYLEQIEPLYQLFTINRSIVWPRASFTFIDHRAIRTAEKENVELSKLFSDLNHIRLEIAQKTFPEEISAELDSLGSSLESGFERLAKRISSLDPTLADSIKKEKGKLLHSIREIRKRAVRAHKSAVTISENRFSAVTYFLLPENGPQERWFGFDAVVSILDTTGLDELIALTSPGEEFHRIVFPSSG